MSEVPVSSMRARLGKRKDRQSDQPCNLPEMSLGSRPRRAKDTDLKAERFEQTIPLCAITDETKNWSAKVYVVSKLGIKTATSSPLKYQKIILADEKGDTVEAMIYKDNIDLYMDKIEESKTYRISNAQVSKVKEMYKNVLISSSYQWTITSSTSVVPVDDTVLRPTPFHPDFLDCKSFAVLRDSKKTICTICVIIETQGPKRIFVRGQPEILHEYAAVDKQMHPFVVTFWANAVSDSTYAIMDACHKRPVVALLNFVVKGYHGLSITSTSSSIVLNDMENNIFKEMKAWCGDQKLFIDGIVEKGGLFEDNLSHIIGSEEPTKTIAEVLESQKVQTFYVEVKAYLANGRQSFIYMCCEECGLAINVNYC